MTDNPWDSPWTTNETQSVPEPISYPESSTVDSSKQLDAAPRLSPWTDNTAIAQSPDDPWASWSNPRRDEAGWGTTEWGQLETIQPGSNLGAKQQEQDYDTTSSHGDRSEEENVDSAVSFGNRQIETAVEVESLTEASENYAQQIWPQDDNSSPTKQVSLDQRSISRSLSPGSQPDTFSVPEGQLHIERPPSRVQELAEMYDGLDRARLSPADCLSRSSTPVIEVSKRQTQATMQEPVSSPSEQDSASEVEEQLAIQDELRNEEPKKTPMKAQCAAFHYPVDMTHLDCLFPSTSGNIGIPDCLPDMNAMDHFTSTSQRKAWYRVSRFGSMRQHDSPADTGNYVRTQWSDSSIRLSSLKIVRRWMEEGSVVGRQGLRKKIGGARGSHVFNWDSTAPEVDIGEVLREERLKQKRVEEKKLAALQAASEAPNSPALSWNQETSPQTAGIPKFSKESSSPISAAFQLVEPLPAHPGAVLKRDSTNGLDLYSSGDATDPGDDDNDNDDEWGDMVISPSLEVPQFMSGPMSEVEAYNSQTTDAKTLTKNHFELLQPKPVDTIPDNGGMAEKSAPFEWFSPSQPTVNTSHSLMEILQPISSLAPDTVKGPNSGFIINPPTWNTELMVASKASLEAEAEAVIPPDALKDERIAADVISQLPDLSYMLRR